MMEEIYDKRVEHYIFSLRHKLGQGSYGQVYAGINEKNGEKVAVKILKRELINKLPIFCKMFSDMHLKRCLMNEIRVMKQLDSPYIVKFLDVFETSNNYYIVQEYCQHGDLEKYLKKKKYFSEREAKTILTQMLRGFLELIKNGIIHRDLKPANILIEKQVFKMGDFGFAKSLENFKTTMMSSLVGTPLYMSPQILNHERYSNKSDIWSLGIIFYECLFGYTPWMGRNAYDLYLNIMKVPLRFPQTGGVSQLAKAFIGQCLEIQENKRLSWDGIYSHPYMAQEFQYQSILESSKSKCLEDKTLYIINDLRQKMISRQIDLYKLFTGFSLKNKKQLTYSELSRLLLTMNDQLSAEDIQAVFERFDEDKSNTIEFVELKKWLQQNQIQTEPRDFLKPDNAPSERRASVAIIQKTENLLAKLKKMIDRYQIDLKMLFLKYDFSKDGSLDEHELSTMVKIIDPSLTPQEISWIFLAFDVNRDGQITCSEFIEIIENQQYEQSSSLIKINLFEPIECNVKESNVAPVPVVFRSLPGPGEKLKEIHIKSRSFQNFLEQH